MLPVIRFCLFLLTLLAVVPVTLPAAAETMTFQMSSDHENAVEIKMFAQSRRNVWPSSRTVFKLEDYDVHNFKISCQRGERICYGAYVVGDTDTYWGVGDRNQQRCRNCCYTCNGRTTDLIHLRAR